MMHTLDCPRPPAHCANTPACCATTTRTPPQDDFFGPEVYSDASLWSKFMTDKQQLLLSCHLYYCS
jgi:hypothetical protein